MMSREEPMLDPNGDVGMSRHLSKVIHVLTAAPSVDKDLKAQLKDILQGTGTIRDLAYSEAFKSLGDKIIPKALADFENTPPAERQRLAELGEVVLDRYRNGDHATPASAESPQPEPDIAPPVAEIEQPHARHVVPGTRKPNRDLTVAPSDWEDEDDQYFRDRNQGGWLR
ncbi:hypothetical protein ACFWUP_18360 [Nocardia sp. NPDC058658]|uniref:hypothetical protein n=1 Tax=Nocardia sp. NPDC058658 TaxID=3346580 RepID=UPI00366A4748